MIGPIRLHGPVCQVVDVRLGLDRRMLGDKASQVLNDVSSPPTLGQCLLQGVAGGGRDHAAFRQVTQRFLCVAG